MSPLYCACDAPNYTEKTNRCARCGLAVVVTDEALGSRNVELEPSYPLVERRRRERVRGMNQAMGEILFDEAEEPRLQDRRDSLSRQVPPVWVDERGAVDVRVVAVLAASAVVVLAVWLLWTWLVGAGVIYGAWRVMARGTRRRRPRSSWSSLGRTAAMMYAAWNSRGLVSRNGRPLRVSVPAKAGESHVDQYGPVPF